MIFVLNELSLHGQFSDMQSFCISLGAVMKIKQTLSHFGHDFKLHRKFKDANVIGSTTVKKAIHSLPIDKKRSVMSWITTVGPFWSDLQQHSSSDNISIDGLNVAESALAEAGYYCYLGIKTSSVSFAPSRWTSTPISINVEGENIAIDNFWSQEALNTYLQDKLPTSDSWKVLEENSRICFPSLTILNDAFSYLFSEPFAEHIAKEVFLLLGVLNFLKCNINEDGEQTSQWKEMFRQYFVGVNPRFTDSSDSEKRDFNTELHFRNPETQMRDLYCPWHGKIHSPQIRIHFTYPIKNDEPLYVAYIGPKITKR